MVCMCAARTICQLLAGVSVCEGKLVPATGIRLRIRKTWPAVAATGMNMGVSVPVTGGTSLCVCKWNWCQLLESGQGVGPWTVIPATGMSGGQ